jgi:hypothetical protein
LTLGANLGVLVGIALLIYEIDQATLTTRADMISSHNDRWVSIDLSWQSGEFAATWAKAMETPEDLTVAEMVQLNGFMWAFFDHISTTRTLWRLGILENPSNTADELIASNAYIFLGNKFSRAWVEENRRNLSSEAMATIDSVLESVSENETLDMYDGIMERIRE